MGKSKNKNRSRPTPQPGDPDYKSPTQLRNARKRRKLQRERQPEKKQDNKSLATTMSTTASSAGQQQQDPSLQYLDNPKAAPTVQAAIRFFTSHLQHSFPVHIGPTTGWRTVARLAVRRNNNSTNSIDSNPLKMGLFVPGSHDILEVPHCPAHHPQINAMVQVLQEQCRIHNIQPFEETTGAGNLRYVAISIERTTGNPQVVLVWNETQPKKHHDHDDDPTTKPKNGNDDFIQSLITSESSTIQLHSLWIHTNNSWKHANSIVDRNGSWKHCYGPKRLEEVIQVMVSDHELYVPLYFPPQVFRQANLDAFAQIIIKIRTWLINLLETTHSMVPKQEDGDDEQQQQTNDSNKKKRRRGKQQSQHQRRRRFDHGLELYGGVGTIGLHLVDLFDRFESSDENPYNQECFEATVSNLTIHDKPLRPAQLQNITYQAKSASDMVQGSRGRALLQNANVLIVDPPRKGLDAAVVEGLCAEYPSKESSSVSTSGSSFSTQALIYVSCGFDAFQRDYDALVGSGKWKLDQAEGHILFPGSDAIETLAFFTRETQKN